ncbi:endolytic transglycosylase MltG [Cetobacterium sp. 2A]|uniref:endolytic transglycosylase MltG n=1 Tax=Cetobacterium sp. 2A TaxID=2754723 RepID=UPI00163C80B0|nr:endolytic transglycosylase MltG [Cetobacterium sp. 2A]MBC2856559.1 endolytic transglycosylase MltG [Cetobacterium sp. 2A]
MKRILFMISITIGVLLSGYLYYTNEVGKKRSFNKILEIKRGEPLKKSLECLEIENNIPLKIYIKSRNNGKDIKAGYYEIKGEYSYAELIEILESGKQKVFKFTVPEGYSIENIIEVLERDGRGSKENFKLALSQIEDFPYPTPNKNFEGYLYPETYFLAENSTEKDIVNKMLKEFLRKFPVEKYPDKEDFYQKLIMASILEREAQVKSEKIVMASVFYNRMKRGMTLSSDATVNFLYNYKKKRMYYKDLEIDSPYNTYKYKGLPPAPIANPDYESVMAAYNPATTDYLFFVAIGDGSHYFSKTYREHLEIQKKNSKK